MKRTPLLLFLLLGAALWAQPQQPNLGLIPTPQRVELAQNAKVCVPAKAKIKEQQVKFGRGEGANWSQMYRLTVEPRRITLFYEGAEGRENAYKTLAQLRQLYDTLPCMTITDWPAYRYRGWMDDQSRGPVPHAAYRQKQWETLRALKYNFCNYYTEHTLYQPEFPDLAPAYLADCRPHPDEVINLQLFAHAEKTLRVPLYLEIMDSQANFNPAAPETYYFLRERIRAAIQRIPDSPFFIINCDETEQLGSGRAKALVDSLGADQVYVNHINRCCELIDELFFLTHQGQLKEGDEVEAPRVVMWGDIVAKNPAMMKQLPEEMTYIMWAYEPLDSYDHLIKPFKENGTPFWVAPSLSHSSNMIPNPHRYMKNIANLARDGWRNGAEGLMNTCWDDNGEALFDNCWHGLFWSAEMAWNPIRTDDPEEFRRREQQFNENFERLFYGTPDLTHSSVSKAAVDSTRSSTFGSPNLGEQPKIPLASDNDPDRGSHSSPKLGEVARRDGGVCKTQHVNTLYEVGALESNPLIGDWYTSAALMEPLLNFNPANTGEEMLDRIKKIFELMDSIDVDPKANPHAHYALSRMEATWAKNMLRIIIHEKLTGTASVPDQETKATIDNALSYFSAVYLKALFDLKREYLLLWDQENGDYERYIILNRYDDLAREVLELDRHVFISVGCDAMASHPTVSLRTLGDDRPIYFTLDGSEPTTASTRYTAPFPLERSATIRAIAYNEYGEGVITSQYLLSHLGMGAKIALQTPFSTYKSIYSGGGENALIDGQMGSNTTYADGHWQGYWGDSIDAIIDFGKPKAISKIRMRFMQNTFDWILAPTCIKVYTSDDGKQWQLATEQHFDMDPRETGMRLKNYSLNFQSPILNAQFLRVVVPNPGPLPAWHPAPGQPSYLFTDEIVIE